VWHRRFPKFSGMLPALDYGACFDGRPPANGFEQRGATLVVEIFARYRLHLAAQAFNHILAKNGRCFTKRLPLRINQPNEANSPLIYALNGPNCFDDGHSLLLRHLADEEALIVPALLHYLLLPIIPPSWAAD